MFLAYKDTNRIFKILPIILLSLFFIMILSSSCFAYDIKTTLDDETYTFTIPEELINTFENVYVFYRPVDTWAKLYIVCSNLDLAIDPNNTKALISSYGSEESLNEAGTYYYISDSFPDDISIESLQDELKSLTIDNFRKASSTLYSNGMYRLSVGFGLDILETLEVPYTKNALSMYGGDVVFPQAPPQGEIARATSSVNFSETLAQILAILPILLLTVIGLLALRKGLQLLFQTLRQA